VPHQAVQSVGTTLSLFRLTAQLSASSTSTSLRFGEIQSGGAFDLIQLANTGIARGERGVRDFRPGTR
jgi:hypothetical protein